LARGHSDTFGIADAMLIAPGDGRSILHQRLSRRGRELMPPLVITSVDEQAVALFRDWIGAGSRAFVRAWIGGLAATVGTNSRDVHSHRVRLPSAGGLR
jgi:hypothetical protein